MSLGLDKSTKFLILAAKSLLAGSARQWMRTGED